MSTEAESASSLRRNISRRSSARAGGGDFKRSGSSVRSCGGESAGQSTAFAASPPRRRPRDRASFRQVRRPDGGLKRRADTRLLHAEENVEVTSRISVIVCTFNRCNSLAETLESLN